MKDPNTTPRKILILKSLAQSRREVFGETPDEKRARENFERQRRYAERSSKRFVEVLIATLANKLTREGAKLAMKEWRETEGRRIIEGVGPDASEEQDGAG